MDNEKNVTNWHQRVTIPICASASVVFPALERRDAHTSRRRVWWGDDVHVGPLLRPPGHRI